MGGTDRSRGLYDPGLSLRPIAEVRYDPTAPVGLRHLDADAPILLPDQPVYCIDHTGPFSSPAQKLNRRRRVPWLLLVVPCDLHYGLLVAGVGWLRGADVDVQRLKG